LYAEKPEDVDSSGVVEPTASFEEPFTKKVSLISPLATMPSLKSTETEDTRDLEDIYESNECDERLLGPSDSLEVPDNVIGMTKSSSRGARCQETLDLRLVAMGDDPAIDIADQVASNVGVQAATKGDDRTIVNESDGMGYEVEIMPTSNLMAPLAEEQENSLASTLTDSAAGEPRIGTRKKGAKGTRMMSQLQYYRQLEAAKEMSRKRPGKNILGLRCKGDPHHSEKVATKMANMNLIGLRASSKVKQPYHVSSPRLNKPSLANKTKQGVRIDWILQ
jgi:hypothetical protein